MKKLFTLFLICGVALNASAQTPNCLFPFISEYVEGWENNKAIEIYNPTGYPINLAGYELNRYVNGSAVPSGITLVGGIVQPYDTYVIVLDKRDPNGTGLEAPIWAELEAAADTFVNPIFDFGTSAMYFNGNDAVSLTSPTQGLIDVFGRIGEDPGVAWSDQNGTWWTANKTLIRKANIEYGDFIGTDVFMPQVQWDSLPANTFTELGTHACSCYTPACGSSTNFAQLSGLNTSYNVSDGPVTLVGLPAGGVFFGNGVSGNQFSPGSAGVGTHSIIYTIVDGNGCVHSDALCTTVDLNIGIGSTEISSTEGLDVYPNPSSGQFNLSISDVTGIASYSVFDVQGKEVHYDSFVLNSAQQMSIIDLTGLANGVYMLQVTTQKGTFSEQLVKE